MFEFYKNWRSAVSRQVAALGMIILFLQSVSGQETNAISSLADLQQNISTFLAQPRFDGALWGVKVISLDTDVTLFESHADRLMSPASNCKLFTAATALDRFGGDYKISTPIYATAKVDWHGTIHGNLIIAGRGDPTWNSRRFGTNFWDIFEPFVLALKNAGVRRVAGDLIADATYFHGEPTISSLTIDNFQYGECPYISALTIDDGLVEVHIEPASIGAPCRLSMLQPDANLTFSNLTTTVPSNGIRHIEYYMPFGKNIIYVLGQLPADSEGEWLDIPHLKPAQWFGDALKDALARNGIKISGKVRNVTWPQSFTLNTNRAVKIGDVLSPPLRNVIRLYMKPSQNLENDILLADVGEATRDTNTPPWRTSEKLGLAAVHRFLSENDLRASDVHLDEGSGLSDNNMATANAFVALLQFMWRSHAAQDFIDALPIAGVDGTLHRRYHDTPAAGNLRAKTGTLRWANSLSGYVTSGANEHLAFCLLLNRYAAPRGHNGQADLAAVAEMLANFSRRSQPSPEMLEKTYAPLGQLILTHMTSAPFPDPERANGHWYGNQFFSAAVHYSDNTVALFIPKNFRPSDKVDFVVHFHGWRHTLAGTLPEYKLIDQFAASGKNAILIVPQGPYNVPDSFGGKLENTNGFKMFMNETVEKLRASGALRETNFGIGKIILSGHSGGYEVMSTIVDHGGLADKIKEVWLFDALYAGTENFVAWQKAENGRLLDIYTDHGGTEHQTGDLMASLKTQDVHFFFNEDTNATPEDLQTNKLIFLHTDLIHNDVVSKRGEFEEFLKTSCLENK